MNTYYVATNDHYTLSVHTFEIEQPKAVIQIIHGMEEHQERYEDFAHFLNENGYCVVTSDVRGHGPTADLPGHFKDKKGYLELLSDQIRIRQFIAKAYPNLPVYLFAHSMGTIIARVLLQSQALSYKKVALSGYPNYRFGARIGILYSALIRKIMGPSHKSKFLQKASVGVFNKAVSNSSTDVDWICHNQETVKAYIEDPYCGIGFTCAAFNDLYRLMIMMHRPKSYHDFDANMPILLLRGLDDPCIGGKRGAKKSYKVLVRAGFRNIARIEYPDMRHEILNETGHQVVYDDILAFYEKKDV